MKATQIANGKEIVHTRPVFAPGYRTPSKSMRFAKKHMQFLKRSVKEEEAVPNILQSSKKKPLLTMAEMLRAEERVHTRSNRSGSVYRMKNH